MSEATSGSVLHPASRCAHAGYTVTIDRDCSAANHRFACPAPFRKIFRFPPDANHHSSPRRLVPPKGRIAVVTDAGRDAMDADGAADEQRPRRTAKSCGPDASTLASSLRFDTQATVTTKPDHRGATVLSRAVIGRGRAPCL